MVQHRIRDAIKYNNNKMCLIFFSQGIVTLYTLLAVVIYYDFVSRATGCLICICIIYVYYVYVQLYIFIPFFSYRAAVNIRTSSRILRHCNDSVTK